MESVWLDEIRGLRISIRGHDGKWPVPPSSSPSGVEIGLLRGRARRFEESIPRPEGPKLVTLMVAGEYIARLPEAVHTAAEWQPALEALILVATLGGPTMFARIGITRALEPSRGARV